MAFGEDGSCLFEIVLRFESGPVTMSEGALPRAPYPFHGLYSAGHIPFARVGVFENCIHVVRTQSKCKVMIRTEQAGCLIKTGFPAWLRALELEPAEPAPAAQYLTTSRNCPK